MLGHAEHFGERPGPIPELQLWYIYPHFDHPAKLGRPDDNHRRGWITAGYVAAALISIGIADLVVAPRHEIPGATVLVGATLPVLGSVGMIRAD